MYKCKILARYRSVAMRLLGGLLAMGYALGLSFRVLLFRILCWIGYMLKVNKFSGLGVCLHYCLKFEVFAETRITTEYVYWLFWQKMSGYLHSQNELFF